MTQQQGIRRWGQWTEQGGMSQDSCIDQVCLFVVRWGGNDVGMSRVRLSLLQLRRLVLGVINDDNDDGNSNINLHDMLFYIISRTSDCSCNNDRNTSVYHFTFLLLNSPAG